VAGGSPVAAPLGPSPTIQRQSTIFRAGFCDLPQSAIALAVRAPTLREAVEKAAERGLPYLILDGALIAKSALVLTQFEHKMIS
jgi:hypothetical protein